MANALENRNTTTRSAVEDGKLMFRRWAVPAEKKGGHRIQEEHNWLKYVNKGSGADEFLFATAENFNIEILPMNIEPVEHDIFQVVRRHQIIPSEETMYTENLCVAVEWAQGNDRDLEAKILRHKHGIFATLSDRREAGNFAEAEEVVVYANDPLFTVVHASKKWVIRSDDGLKTYQLPCDIGKRQFNIIAQAMANSKRD